MKILFLFLFIFQLNAAELDLFFTVKEHRPEIHFFNTFVFDSKEKIGRIVYIFENQKSIKIIFFTIDQEHQLQGYGKYTLSLFEQYIRKIYPFITVITLHSLKDIQDFYIKCGYKTYSKDSCTMIKPLI